MRMAGDRPSKRAYVGCRASIHVPVLRVGRETRWLRVQATRDETELVATEKEG
jgi:hypothetical protein